VVENPYHISTAYIGTYSQQENVGAHDMRDNRSGLGDGGCIYLGDGRIERYTEKNVMI
jgi:hypothetical protein